MPAVVSEMVVHSVVATFYLALTAAQWSCRITCLRIVEPAKQKMLGIGGQGIMTAHLHRGTILQGCYGEIGGRRESHEGMALRPAALSGDYGS